jgi:hypothetical protein
MKKNLFLLMMIAFVATMTMTSCGDADPCKDVECGQSAAVPTGDCFEGECVCNVGFEGTACADEWATKFIGDYTGKDKCGDSTYVLSTPAAVTKVSGTKLKIVNFAGFFPSFIEADIEKATEASLTADVLKINYTDLAGRKFVGTGALAGKVMTGAYTVTYPDNTSESCTFEYTKP